MNSSKVPSRVAAKLRRWKRRLKWTAVLATVVLLILTLLVRSHIRTLWSLRRIPGTHAYVMDYYCDYHLDEIRSNGIDPRRIEDSYIRAFFPDLIVPLASRLKQAYVPAEINSPDAARHHCSSVTLISKDGGVFFGRNFDWPYDACLVLRVHDDEGLSSIAVIDLHYLNLDRADLDETNLLERLPLLFAPYYVMDGMNRHGVAMSEMSVSGAAPPRDAQKPDMISATLMRVILDGARDTDEAIQLIQNYNVCFPHAEVHFMVADATGDSRIAEFINGEIKQTRSLGSWQDCTNSVVWNQSERDRDRDCPRYETGSAKAEELQGVMDHAGAVEVAHSMAVDNYTMWTTVYDLQDGGFRFLYKSRPETEYRDTLPRGPS